MDTIQSLIQQITRSSWRDWLDIIVVAYLIHRLLPLLRTHNTVRIAKAVIVVVLQYTYFKSTGFLLWGEDQTHLMVVWLYPLFAMLPVSALISRAVFKKTGNPYLPGIINAIIIALMSCANTCTFM